MALIEAQIAADELAACSPMASEGSEDFGDQADDDDGQEQSEEEEDPEASPNEGDCEAEEEILQSQECLLDEEDMPSGSSSEEDSDNVDGEPLSADEVTPDPTSLKEAKDHEEEEAVRNSAPDEISFEVLCDLRLKGYV